MDDAIPRALAALTVVALAGSWTLESSCDHAGDARSVAGGRSAEWGLARNFRNWTFESAALDLALRQAGLSLPDVLGRPPRPLHVRELARARRSAVGGR